ncbi:MAG: class I tRNA ligase family protein [Methanomicrobiales archaeon]|nr:class I tRNA ligase family protein [Methanomicrobiales archaeon]
MVKFYSTLSRQIETFVPRRNGVVKMFTCGPSVYQRPHIGNFRTFIFEDILQRYLEYLGYAVERVLNFTDVEDKAIAAATDEGIALSALSDRGAAWFYHDADRLRIKPPAHNPRSSTSVDAAVSLIRQLLEQGSAYWYDSDIFFDPLKFPGFGKLFRLDMSRWPKTKRRFRKDTYPGVQWNRGDFILWHGYRTGDPVYWDTAIGRGRPSWNIQDPAMAVSCLGPEIDIACGGEDNLYRHHDYTIAIIESLTGREFAHYWFHGGHLLIDGQKMSKSRGNIIDLDDLLQQGFSIEEIRFFLAGRHYRSRLNFTARGLEKSREILHHLRGLAAELNPHGTPANTSPAAGKLSCIFREHMDNDLDLEGAVQEILVYLETLDDQRRRGELSAEESQQIEGDLRKIDSVLQCVFPAARP